MRRLLGAAALCALLLSACGDAADNPAPSDPSTAAPSEVAPTTAVPHTARVTATTAPDSTTASSATTAAASGTAATTPPRSATTAPPATPTTPAPAPSSAAPEPAPRTGECTGDQLSQDILGFPGGVHVYFCEGDWAYASYPQAPGEPEFLAERVDGRWFHAVAFGDPVCREELAARGAPPSIAKLLPGCDELPAPPTTAPPTTAPGPDCVINTNLYGDTHAELIAVTCEEATAEWELAEANAEPSWTVPWITPTGWECYVTPYDPTSKAAGACYGPDNRAYFTLFLP